MFKEFTTECKRNPFFWWGIMMWFLLTFNSFWIFNQILQAIVIYRLYIPILFISVTLSIIIAISPIWQGLRKYSKEVSTKRAVFSLIVIFMFIYADAVYFELDPSMIFGRLSPGILPETILNYATNVQILSQFIALPLFYTIMIVSLKRTLAEKNCKINDEFKNNYRFTAEIVLINTIACLVALYVTSK